MITLLADVNIEGHLARLASFMQSAYWQDLHSRDYLERVVESLFDYLLRIGSLRGTGRLFLP